MPDVLSSEDTLRYVDRAIQALEPGGAGTDWALRELRLLWGRLVRLEPRERPVGTWPDNFKERYEREGEQIPGPDPGACPRCGLWRRAGVPHACPSVFLGLGPDQKAEVDGELSRDDETNSTTTTSVASELRLTASRLRDPEYRWSEDPAVTLERLAEKLEKGRDDG